ncbi:hypothetical protein jhhlp_003487 [Lomentospora prolificans]|uniref:Uncharacterized protein n=1 Tax=Lomentospora prolificans TaxID=41688 RepID=A0A2N3N8W8_9PEZI|nr:hypothetical protein jhhlp_003487 [Lomentospora prolificans]
MALELIPPKPLRQPSALSALTAEQRYWKSFKNQLLIPSPTSFAITHISSPPIGSTNDTFAVTSGTRVQIYSGRTRKLTKTITRFQDVARSGDIRKDGRVLVAGEDTGRIQVFDIGSRAVLKTWTVHKQPVWLTRFSPIDLTAVLSASDDRTVRLWDLPSGEPVNTFFGHTDYVRCASFIPASMSHLLASGGYDSTVKVWDPRSGATSPVMTFKHAAPVEDVLPLPSGTTLLAASGNTISVLDMVAARPLQTMSNHQKTVTSLSLASSGRRFIAGGLDGHVKVYETVGWNVVSTAKYHSPILAVSIIGSGECVDHVDRHLVAGLSSGVLSIRTRLSAKESAKERQREKNMDAILAGTAESHEAKLAKRKRQKAEKRKLDLVGESADVILAEEQRQVAPKKERPWQKKLRRGLFAAALDDLLDPKGLDHGPINILTLLLALRHRGAVRDALSGRDENSVQPILSHPNQQSTLPPNSPRPLLTIEQVRSAARSRHTYTLFGACALGAAVFYFANVEAVPISGRKRFNCYGDGVSTLSDQQLKRILYEIEGQGLRLLPGHDYRTLLVKKVMGRLIPVSGLNHYNWEVWVIDDPHNANAFILPGGKVFVFSGILPVTRNQDGLAAVLGHEIAHNLAQHHGEPPLPGAFFAMQTIGGWLLDTLFGRPMSRKMESEADYIGLMLMAEACYDPREAILFWKRMETLAKSSDSFEVPEWMSTHPSEN